MADHVCPWFDQEASFMVSRLLAWFTVLEELSGLRDDELTRTSSALVGSL